jgi:hypothetical protein
MQGAVCLLFQIWLACWIKILVMKLFISFFVVILFINSSSGQENIEWCRGLSDEAKVNWVDASGNNYLGGVFQGTDDFDPSAGVYSGSSNGMNDCFIVKMDAQGNFLWARTFGSTGFDNLTAIETDAVGNVYMTGNFAGTTDFDPGAGVFNLFPTSADVFVLKLDASGNFVWAVNFGSVSNDGGNDIHVYGNGEVLITGSCDGITDFNPGPGVFQQFENNYLDGSFLLKLDANGDFLWVKTFAPPTSIYGQSFGRSMDVDPSGNIILSGYTQGTIDYDPGPGVYQLTTSDIEVCLQKMDSNGDFLWAELIGCTSTSMYIRNFVTCGSDGSIYLTGMYSLTIDLDPGIGSNEFTANGDQEIFLAKYLPNGNLDWGASIGGIQQDEVNSIAIDELDQVLIAGVFTSEVDFDPGPLTHFETTSGPTKAYILSLSSAGNFNWVHVLSSPVGITAHSLFSVSSEELYLAGTFFGTTDFDSGPGNYSLTSSGGNDGFQLKLICGSVVNLDEIVCDSYTAPDGNVYTSSGNYQAVFLNQAGCDSTFAIDLVVNNASTSVLSESSCVQYIAPDGMIYSTSGNYQAVVTNQFGCDSTITIDLIITQPSTSNISETACASYVAPDGVTYSTSGNYQAVVTNQFGCDSTITIDLTITQPSTSNISETACASYVAPDGVTYSTSGNYQAIIPNQFGCDSTIIIDLIVNNTDVNVVQNGLDLTAAASSASYQWLDCGNSFAVLSGDISQSFSVTSNGDYAVEVTQNGCVDTSDCFTFSDVGTQNFSTNEFSVFPNPSTGTFSVYINFDAVLQLYNAEGQELYSEIVSQGSNTLDYSSLSTGVYILKVLHESGWIVQRLVISK